MILSIGGQKVKSKFVVGVDGPHSNTRKSLSPDTPLKVLPFVAFNGKRRVKRALFDSIYAPQMKTSNVIQFKREDVIMQVMVNEQLEDAVSVGWIYSRPARGSTDPLHKPNLPVSGATDIPGEFFQEVEAITDLEDPFKEVFDADKLRMERVLHWLMRTVLVSPEELQALGRKNAFFMGDSVHAEPIIGGEGANVAITDGLELAECISKRGVEGISEWYEERWPIWEAGVQRSERSIAEMHGEFKAAL